MRSTYPSFPTELQEKARACNSLEELRQLAAENDVELPEEALEFSVGVLVDPCTGKTFYCLKCGSETIIIKEPFYVCVDCGAIDQVGKH